MYKKIVIFGLLLCSSLFFTACFGGEEEAPEQEEITETKEMKEEKIYRSRAGCVTELCNRRFSEGEYDIEGLIRAVGTSKFATNDKVVRSLDDEFDADDQEKIMRDSQTEEEERIESKRQNELRATVYSRAGERDVTPNRRAVGVKWNQEEGYIKTVHVADSAPGYIEYKGIQDYSRRDGYVGNTYVGGHSYEGYLDRVARYGGGEGYLQDVGGLNGQDGYLNRFTPLYNVDGFIENVGGGYTYDNYIDSQPGNYNTDGYLENNDSYYGLEDGYVGQVGGSTIGGGYLDSVGGNNNGGYLSSVGGNGSSNGYVESLGYYNGDGSGYVEIHDPAGYGGQGYVQSVGRSGPVVPKDGYL